MYCSCRCNPLIYLICIESTDGSVIWRTVVRWPMSWTEKAEQLTTTVRRHMELAPWIMPSHNSRRCITMTSWWPRWRHKSPVSRLFTQPFIQTQIKENIKASRHWPLCGEFTGTGEFPTQRASYAENVSIWWRHHGVLECTNIICS